MEFIFIVLLYIVGLVVLWKPMGRLHARIGMRKLQREAETEMYRAINIERARQAAADSILRQTGERR